MSKTRDTSLPQHHLQQGHYGDLSLDELPDADGYPSGTQFIWDGTGYYFGTGGGGSPLTVVELDGSPSVSNVTTIRVSGSTVIDGGGGIAIIATSGSQGVSTDEKVKVSSNDSTAEYLYQQLSGTAGINIYEYYDGGNELVVLSGSTRYSALEVILGDGSSVVTVGAKGYVEVPFECYITQGTVLADTTGILVVDVWKDVYSAYPPTNSDSITASNPLMISGTNKVQDSTLTGWDTHLLTGDILGFEVENSQTIEQATVSLKVRLAG